MTPSPRRPVSSTLVALTLACGLAPLVPSATAAAATGLTCPAGTIA